ncbi:MAG: hypothetical protein J3R72DRAFT_492220 [Linnemannia gamsii]|nr:MAG: hypothetical protein J3R72DRAFT_492220 [Linnemannia gamsii]
MTPSDDEDQGDFQVLRLANTNRAVHIPTHMDPTFGKSIILWGDVLRVFSGALCILRGRKVLPFMQGSDFKYLKPLRITAIHGTVLDVFHKKGATRLFQHGSYFDCFIATSQHREGATAKAALSGDDGGEDDGLQRVSGIQKDYVQAMDWFVKAAEQGHANAVVRIFTLFKCRRGVPKNDPAAVKWYIKATEQGHVPAYKAFASRYEYGCGGSQDDSKASELYFKAAELGDVGVHRKLADLYKAGRGVPMDLVKTDEWHRKAAKN